MLALSATQPHGTTRDGEMARTGKGQRRAQNEAIDVSVFRDIRIRFPGDVYILAL